MGRLRAGLHCLGGAALVLLLAFPGAACARSNLQPLTRAAGPVKTDGDRYAAFPLSGGVTRVIDTARGKTSDFASPPCGDPVRAVGGGELLWDCGAGMTLLDIASGTMRRAADPTVPLGDRYAFAVGAQFIAGFYGKASTAFLVNWHTGVMPEFRLTPRNVVDLDRVDPVVRMCSPVTRLGTTWTEIVRPRSLYRRPYAVFRRRGDLVLERCGRRGTTLIARGVGWAGLAGTVAWWSSNAPPFTLTALDLVSGSRRRWALPADTADLSSTENTVFVTIHNSSGAWDIRTAPLRTPSRRAPRRSG